MTASFSLSHRRIPRVLAIISLLLCLLSLFFTAYEWSLGTQNTYWALQFSEFFGVTHEANVPSWYSSFMLLFAGVLSVFIARASAQDRRYWTAFAILFFYLMLDEAAVIHEMLTAPLREGLQLGGYLYFSWLLVGLPLAILVGLLFVPFLRRLPAHTRNTLIAAGLVYLSGAVLVEAISANQWSIDQGTSLLYSSIGTLEEFLEMQGVVLVIYSLLRYLALHVGSVELRFRPETDGMTQPPAS